MSDPLSAAAAAAKLAKSASGRERTSSLLKRVLGPPADSIGQALAGYVDFRAANAMRILENAQAKAGEELNKEGSVPPRVAGRLLDEGSWCDDALMVEYLGGALASARTPQGRDDRAARWTAVVTALSVYEIRAHYIIYRAVRQLYLDERTRFTSGDGRDLDYAKIQNAGVIMLTQDFFDAMEFQDDEDGMQLMAHAVQGLRREGLVSSVGYAKGETFAKRGRLGGRDAGEFYFSGSPNAAGMELFLFAHGEGRRIAFDMLSSDWSHALREVEIPATPSVERWDPSVPTST